MYGNRLNFAVTTFAAGVRAVEGNGTALVLPTRFDAPDSGSEQGLNLTFWSPSNRLESGSPPSELSQFDITLLYRHGRACPGHPRLAAARCSASHVDARIRSAHDATTSNEAVCFRFDASQPRPFRSSAETR